MPTHSNVLQDYKYKKKKSIIVDDAYEDGVSLLLKYI